MNRPSTLHLAAIAAVAATLLLTGCGRKGRLDPPPDTAATPTAAAPASGEQPQSTSALPTDDDAKPVAATRGKRRLPIDVLID